MVGYWNESYYEAADRELQERNYVAAEEERELAESLEAEAFESRMLAKADAEWMVREFGPLALSLAGEYQVLAADIAEANGKHAGSASQTLSPTPNQQQPSERSAEG